MINIPNSTVQEILAPFGFETSDALSERIRAYIDLLLVWNRTIPLTTVTNPLEIIRFHFGESLFILSFLRPMLGRLADIGSGGGFPGVALKLAAPDLHVTLIESNRKKAAFLSELICRLNLSRTDVFRGRAEDLPDSKGAFEYISARAVGSHQQTLDWSSKRIAKGGRLGLWLGAEGSLRVLQDRGWSWDAPHLIPQTKKRYILIGTKATQTLECFT
jgi:16S rRNA (guanine527-N7)-methyltransferase